MKTKVTDKRPLTLRSNPRTIAEQEAWLALVKQERANGRLKLGKLSRKQELELHEFVVTSFWGLGQDEKASLPVRLQALERLSLIVSVAKTRLLEGAVRG